MDGDNRGLNSSLGRKGVIAGEERLVPDRVFSKAVTRVRHAWIFRREWRQTLDVLKWGDKSRGRAAERCGATCFSQRIRLSVSGLRSCDMNDCTVLDENM